MLMVCQEFAIDGNDNALWFDGITDNLSEITAFPEVSKIWQRVPSSIWKIGRLLFFSEKE
jgi:hypothetical protein